jgi:hypothetical protein
MPFSTTVRLLGLICVSYCVAASLLVLAVS